MSDLPEIFGIHLGRAERFGYSRIVNVADRMLNALYPPETGRPSRAFSLTVHDSKEFQGVPSPYRFHAPRTDVFTKVTSNLEEKVIIGLDIGGTDIKGAVAVKGALTGLKEYDWNPAAYGRADELIDPILAIVRLLRVKATLEQTRTVSQSLRDVFDGAMGKKASFDEITNACDTLESALGDGLVKPDAIGLCFPDVVVKHKIVGGEVPKTKGMRDNSDLDFEEQFSKITVLDERLRELCCKNGVVMNTNDGPMASFTAAVELAASPEAGQIAEGVFAHTLGTDLGTGLVLGDGSIPEIPLEAYNMIVDIGSYPGRVLPAADARSMNNSNTGLPGTLQRFTSQTGAFRLAFKYFPEARPDLMDDMRKEGYFVQETRDGATIEIVPEYPEDMRKPLLAHLMALTVREHDEPTESVFRDIGAFLAVVWQETERILDTGIRNRFLFGRLVKVNRCFELMKEGAALREPQLALVAADSEMAFTPLMKALDADPDYTVAQFGQAIGAIYFGNFGLL